MNSLHIGHLDKFTLPFWGFLAKHLSVKQQQFFFTQHLTNETQEIQNEISQHHFIQGTNWFWFLKLNWYAHRAKQIVFHGLFDFRIIVFFCLQPWLLKKAYWIIWGADLYRHSLYTHTWKWHVKEFFRRPVIRRMGYLVTGTQGDYALAQKWYQAQGKHIRCFNYPSNTFKPMQNTKTQSDGPLKILVGNSADPTNNHQNVFNLLKVQSEQNFVIYCPLSYGNSSDYADRMKKLGTELFGNRFIPLMDFMPFNTYMSLLEDIDIAIFAHDIQQAFGNKISLLGFGKKVYLNAQSTLWDVFQEYGLKVYDLKNLELNRLPEEVRTKNMKIIEQHFSEESLANSLSSWLLI